MTVRLHDAQGTMSGRPERLERKFYVPPARVPFALGLIRHVLRSDNRYPCEQISSLYFDTSALDLYDQSVDGLGTKDKVRIRWYEADGETWGDSRSAFVELKSRRGFASTKRRLEVVVPAKAFGARAVHSGIISPGMLLEALADFGFRPPGPLSAVTNGLIIVWS